MKTRRAFVKSTALLAAAQTVSGTQAATQDTPSTKQWRMPDEAEPHARTWMAFGASHDVWGGKLLPEVQRNLAAIALAIAKFEPVAMLVRHNDLSAAKKLVGHSHAIELIVSPLDDLWMRDIGPVFVKGQAVSADSHKAAVNFNFNGWGDKQTHRRDATVAPFVASRAKVDLLKTSLVLEGGGIEVDGHGTAIITESCVLNANRNPGVSKAACEAELQRLLGVTKVIWLPGIKGKDITDGHTDFYARFARPGVVVAGYDPDPASFDHAVTKKHLDILKAATDAQGRSLAVTVLSAPGSVRKAYESKEFAAGYINFYVCNGAVIAPEFGDAKADGEARDKLKTLFPGRQVIQLNIDGVAAGGGGIHCTTQQEPA